MAHRTIRAALCGVVAAALAIQATAAGASVSAPARSLRWLGGRQVWVPLCSRRGVNGSAAYFDNVNTAVMDQQACISPSWGTVTALKLVFAAFDMPQQGEVDRPVTATGTAAIFVPGANTIALTSVGQVNAGALTLNAFASTLPGVNGLSLGQSITSPMSGLASGSYVAGIANSFTAGSGNTPGSTVVTLNAAVASGGLFNTQALTFGGLFVPVKFGGKRSFLVEPGHDVVTSDPVSVQLAPSTWFLVRTSASMSGTGLQLMDVPVASRLTVTGSGGASFQEFDSRGTVLNDQTMNPSALGNTGGGYWGPVTVLAQVTVTPGLTPPGAALILGDSIAAGSGDLPDTLGLEGYIQRSLENAVPFVSAARGSTTAFGLLSHGDGQYALSIDTGITDVILEPGRNDIQQTLTSAASLEATIQALVTRYVTAGKRVWCTTVPPTTYSNDGWITAANQGFPLGVANTGAASTATGSVQVTLASTPSSAWVGSVVGLNLTAAGAIAAGTTVTAVNTTTLVVTLSQPTTGALAAGTKLYFGTQNAAVSTAEVPRTTYNAYLRANWSAMGCSHLIDIDGVVADPVNTGKWRTDLGQASADGVHPSPALHQAAVNANLLTPAMFAIP